MIADDIIDEGKKRMVYGKNPGPANYDNDEQWKQSSLIESP